MNSLQIRKLTYAALFLALAMVLPFLTGQIPQIGKSLCPMHIPALLCGFLCGWPWGLAVGLIAPLLRSVTFGMPAMFPDAVGGVPDDHKYFRCLNCRHVWHAKLQTSCPLCGCRDVTQCSQILYDQYKMNH